MADDLDSFFQEINQVTAETASLVENSAYDLYGDNYDGAAKASAISSAPSNKVSSQVIISKPASSQSVVTHHPVYTYSFTPQSPSLEENFSSESNSYAFKPPAPSVPYGTSSSSSHNHSAPLPPNRPGTDKKFVRKAADEIWVDDTLKEWPDNDYRIFVGDLAKEVTTEMLGKAFQHYQSYARAKVIRTKHENKARGFGFVSFMDPMDCAKAIREMNGKYIGTRPMKIRKSTWKDRDIKEVHKKETKKRKMEEQFGLA